MLQLSEFGSSETASESGSGTAASESGSGMAASEFGSGGSGAVASEFGSHSVTASQHQFSSGSLRPEQQPKFGMGLHGYPQTPLLNFILGAKMTPLKKVLNMKLICKLKYACSNPNRYSLFQAPSTSTNKSTIHISSCINSIIF